VATLCPIIISITAGTIAISDSVTISVLNALRSTARRRARRSTAREMQAERLHSYLLEPDRLHVGQGGNDEMPVAAVTTPVTSRTSGPTQISKRRGKENSIRLNPSAA